MSPKRIAAVIVGVAVLIVVIFVSIAHIPKSVPTTRHALPARHSMIYGTNLGLYDANDQMLNNSTTQQLLKNARVPIIRMPFRTTLDDVYEVEALRAIQYIGAVPLVIVYGPYDANALADDMHILDLVHRVFGDETVYIEFGNESNVEHIDAHQYAASWSTVIPALKAKEPTYKYIGPALSVFDANYLSTFDSEANPRPDANTWHEYACYPTSTNQECLDNTASWSTHLEIAKEASQAHAGYVIPAMITEWNLDASRDTRFTDSAFMRTWTTRALQTLASGSDQGLVAALQYCVTNNDQYRLLDAENALTPQGDVFFHALQSS